MTTAVPDGKHVAPSSSAPSIADVVTKLTFHDEASEAWEDDYLPDMVEGLTKELRKANDPSYLALVNDIASALHGAGCFGSFVIVRGNILEGNHDVIRSLTPHLGWITKNPVETAILLTFYIFMRSDDYPAVTITRNIEAQAEAFRRIRDHGYGGNSHFHFASDYFNNAEFMDMVDRHADHVHALLQYREERGMDEGEDMEPLDEKDFAAYLSQGTVAGGWL